MSTNDHMEWRNTLPRHPMKHHGECWRVHHACAILKIEKLQEELKRLEEEIDNARQGHRD